MKLKKPIQIPIMTLQEWYDENLKEYGEYLKGNELNEMAVHRIDDETYKFDFKKDQEGGIINLRQKKLFSNNKKFDNVYKFGYKFNDNVSKTLRLEFIRKLKGIQNFENDDEFKKFILKPLDLLKEHIKHIWNIDICLFPQSRSPINREIEKYLSDLVRTKPFLTFELFKQNMQNVKFDFDRYIKDNDMVWITDLDKERAIKRAEDYIQKIKKRDYFSIARMDGKYKKYFTSFLKYDNEKLENIISKKEDMNVLILDDISTTGSTIKEMINYVYTIGGNHNIYIFSIIDN